MDSSEFLLVEEAMYHWKKLSPILTPVLYLFARVCLLSTFFDDAIRTSTRYQSYKRYLTAVKHYPSFVADVGLIVIVLGQLCPVCAVLCYRARVKAMCLLMFASRYAVKMAAFGLMTDKFQLISTGVVPVAGLLMTVMESLPAKSPNSVFRFHDRVLHNEVDPNFRLKSLSSVANRLLMLSMFLAFHFSNTLPASCRQPFSVGAVALTALLLCVAVGYNTRRIAACLLVVTAVWNVRLNGFWTLDLEDAHDASRADHLRHLFFQYLTVVGGLALILLDGPGTYSIDKRKDSKE